MGWLNEPVYLFLIIGVVAILVEIVVLQLTTFWLLFIGIGALIASLVLFLFPGLGWLGGMIVFVVATVGITLALYKPLKRWQHGPSPMKGNDAQGQQVLVIETINPDDAGKVSWSGADWRAVLVDGADQPLKAGQEGEIVEMSGITLIVK